MLTVSEDNYQLEFSARYSGDVHDEATTERYYYCVGLRRAFDSLISEEYRSFILTIACFTAAIVYSPDDGNFKVFDAHTTDIYGKRHHQGTCVLLDISSKDD